MKTYKTDPIGYIPPMLDVNWDIYPIDYPKHIHDDDWEKMAELFKDAHTFTEDIPGISDWIEDLREFDQSICTDEFQMPIVKHSKEPIIYNTEFINKVIKSIEIDGSLSPVTWVEEQEGKRVALLKGCYKLSALGMGDDQPAYTRLI